MTGHGLLYIGICAVLTVTSNLLLRAGVARAGGFGVSSKALIADALSLAQQPLFVGGLVLYGTAALVWFRVLSTENLNTSYPVLVSLTFVLVTLGGSVFFREPVSWQKILGLAIILAGILAVVRSE